MPVKEMTGRNVGIDYCKLLAACFVVLIHYGFPETFGSVTVCMARAAVPWFFAVAGYFSCGADCRRIAKRLGSVLRLNLWGVLLVLLWGCLATELRAGSYEAFQGSSALFLRDALPQQWELMNWLVLDVNPFNSNLWFLTTLLKCYGILWCYVRFFGQKQPDYRGLYLAAAVLFLNYLILGLMFRALNLPTSPLLLRGTLLLGIPMFTLGLFLRQYGRQILENFRLTAGKLWLLVLLGNVLAWAEFGYAGNGDAYMGSVLVAGCALLLAVRRPGTKRGSRLAALCGRWSVGIYLCHNVSMELVEIFAAPRWGYVVPGWIWLRPLLVIGLSLAMAMANEALWTLLRKCTKG